MNYGLPWTNSGRTVHGNTIFQDVATAQNIELAAYIVRACNNHERLLAALRQIDNIALSHPYAGNTCGEIARALLAELETNT